VIHLRGELDRVTAPTLAACLGQLIDADTRCTAVVIDLVATTFVDVGGLNLLLRAHRRAEELGTALRLAGCSPYILRMLQATATREVLQVVPDQGPAGRGGAAGATESTDHTALPSANSVTPHRLESADTTCNPRPRRAPRSIGRGRGGGHR